MTIGIDAVSLLVSSEFHDYSMGRATSTLGIPGYSNPLTLDTVGVRIPDLPSIDDLSSEVNDLLLREHIVELSPLLHHLTLSTAARRESEKDESSFFQGRPPRGIDRIREKRERTHLQKGL